MDAVIEISVAIYMMSEKNNNIIAVWLLALNMLLESWGLLLSCESVFVCMSGNMQVRSSMCQCVFMYSGWYMRPACPLTS